MKLLTLATIAIFLSAPRISAADPVGVWADKDGGTVRIHRCGQALCGTMASVKPDPATGQPPTDKNNADATKRNRPLVGIQVLISMRPNGAGKWSGSLYDTDSGKFYPGHLLELDRNTVRVEGCAMGICGGETMTRVSR